MTQRYILHLFRRTASKQALVLSFILVTMFVSFRCMKTPAEPEMPTWAMQLTLPIVDRTFYFSELVAKDTLFETMPNGEVVYRPSNMVNKPTPIPIPTLTPVSASLSNKLGMVPISVSGMPGVDLSVSQILGQAPPPYAWPLADPPARRQNIPIISDTAAYDYVVFDQARMLITVQNSMNFAVSFPSGLMIYNVNSATDSTLLTTINLGQINAHSSVTVPAPLSGRTMSSRLKLIFDMTTVGLNGTVIDPNGKISATMGIDGGSVGTSASMQSAKVRITGDYGVAKSEGSIQVLDDSIWIARAEFSQGGFDLRITNSVPVDIVAGLVLKEVINKKTGQPFRLVPFTGGSPQDSIIIPRNSVFVQHVNMADYSFISQNVVGGKTLPVNGVHYILTVKTLKATADKRVISVNDEVAASLIPQSDGNGVVPYRVSQFSGVVHPTTVSINETVDTKFGDVKDTFTADSINTDNATIIMKLYTPTSYPVDMSMKVTAWRDGVQGMSMSVPAGNGGLNGSFRILPGDTARIVFNKATTAAGGTSIDQFINSFLSNGKVRLPDKITLTGGATIQPTDTYNGGANGTVGTATDHDSLYSSLEFVFPLRMAVKNGAFRDTVEIDNSDTSSSKDDYDPLENGSATFEVENYFPADGSLNLVLMGSKAQNDTLMTLTKTPIHITGAQYNAGGANTPARSFSTVTVGKGDWMKFKKARFSAITGTLKTGTNGQTVAFRATDKIRVKAYGTFKMNVDFNKMKSSDSNNNNSNGNNPNGSNQNNNHPY